MLLFEAKKNFFFFFLLVAFASTDEDFLFTTADAGLR